MQENIRTLGDGMDNISLNDVCRFNQTSRFSPVRPKLKIDKIRSFTPVEPKSQVYSLVPRYVPKMRKAPKYLIKKPKEPKFVPYEPYKAAVESIISQKTPSILTDNSRTSKNDIEILELVNQMSEMRKLELNRKSSLEDEKGESYKLLKQWAKEKEELLVDIKNLRESNSHLENQLKFQAQVNSELKTLLVAAVGEDLESRVQHLTEDKLSLARALLNSAHNLTSHQEQTEWLSGQCEVWKSKFLASSLMVEELAKWKSALTNKINDLQEVTKTLLRERRKMHIQGLKTFTSLKCIAGSLANDENRPGLKYGNILEVTNINVELSKYIREKMGLEEEEIFGETMDTHQQTFAEKAAYRLIQNPVSISTKQDLLCNAVMGAASSLGGNQSFHQQMGSCCSHCKGDVQNI
nr:golgin-45-like [Leptinotarsa decemlineata]